MPTTKALIQAPPILGRGEQTMHTMNPIADLSLVSYLDADEQIVKYLYNCVQPVSYKDMHTLAGMRFVLHQPRFY